MYLNPRIQSYIWTAWNSTFQLAAKSEDTANDIITNQTATISLDKNWSSSAFKFNTVRNNDPQSEDKWIYEVAG